MKETINNRLTASPIRKERENHIEWLKRRPSFHLQLNSHMKSEMIEVKSINEAHKSLKMTKQLNLPMVEFDNNLKTWSNKSIEDGKLSQR